MPSRNLRIAGPSRLVRALRLRRDFTQTYLGVNAAQSARSGLPQFKAGAGILSYGAAAQVSYQWTPRLETSAFIQANRLRAMPRNPLS